MTPAGQATAANFIVAHAETDRWTDARHLHKPCSAYHTGSADNQRECVCVLLTVS